ncbi:MAG: MBL fold metallo-hydrolase [Gemmatimonadota bacterium]
MASDSAAAPARAVPLTEDLYWIAECFPLGDGRHEHVSVYLIRTGDHGIIVDSGSFYHRGSIEAKLKAATASTGVNALILSHSDFPHSGNVDAFRAEWGDFDIYCSAGEPAVQGLPYAIKCPIGGSREILGRKFSFIDPPLADRSHTSWIYDHASRTLFAADGFGHYHRPGECEWTSREYEGGIGFADIFAFHRDTIRWLRYVDPVKFRRKIETMLADYDAAFIAPIHGNPIAAADLDAYIDHLVEAAARISRAYRPGQPA